MAGTIRTKEKCPKCGGKFELTPAGLICKICFTTPRKVYIDLHHKGRRYRIFANRMGIAFRSFAEAQRALEAIRYEIDQKTFDPSRYIQKSVRLMRLETYAYTWLEATRQQIRKTSYEQRYFSLKNHIIPYFKGMDIREIRHIHIQDFLNTLIRYKPLTRQTILRNLHGLLAWAYDRDDIEKIPKFPIVKTETKTIEWINQATQEKILSFIPEPYQPVIKFLIVYGCRPGEAVALQWDAVDFEKKEIIIKRTFARGKIHETNKENRWRVLPMTDAIALMLKDLKTKNPFTKFVFDHPGKKKQNPDIARGSYHLCYIWRAAAREAGVDIKLYNGTRHSFAMQRLQEGWTLAQVSAALGHSNITTTQRYGRLISKSLKPIFERQPDQGIVTNLAIKTVTKPSPGGN